MFVFLSDDGFSADFTCFLPRLFHISHFHPENSLFSVWISSAWMADPLDVYGPSSQTLTFVDGDLEPSLLHGATQDSTYDFDHDFTLPSQSQQSQSQSALSAQGHHPGTRPFFHDDGGSGRGELTFQDEDETPVENLPRHACR
jgi:hypothetical protein